MNKFRASYSVLNTWESGQYERAVEMYFKLSSFTTEAMAEGKIWHKKFEEEIKKTGCLPKIFGGDKLINPRTEVKKVIEIYDWLQLVGVIDLLDSPTVIDFKTGKGSSESSAGSHQLGLYGVLCTFDKIKVTKGQIMHYDQYKKTVDTSTVWLTDRLLEDTMNWLITLSGSMHDYLNTNKLYERFGKN